LQCTEEFIAQGFRAIKFHAYAVPERDIALAEAVRRRFPSDDIAFMLDPENRYTREEALRVARVLDDVGFTWFEAPLPDFDLTGYRALREAVDVPILPAGNWITDLSLLREYLAAGAWDTARVDATTCGGITQAKKIMALAESFDMNCELQCWGYTLNQAANLHMMLAVPNCTYFEQPVPYPSFEYGMIDVIRPDVDGCVTVPNVPGLGLRIDWEAMKAATILEFP
jgi:L-alanine-DL-glutamate epimerase-like enolase superfamily enzyme